jgi:hypothetical protein
MTITPKWLALAGFILSAPALAGERGAPEGTPPFRTPPQEAQEACAKLALGAACSFKFHERAHQGVCRRGPEGQGPVACAPHRGPGQEGERGQDGGKAGSPSERP